jgi:hypothetical protein
LLVVIAAIGVVAFAAGALVGHMSTVRSGSAVRQQVLPLSELGAPKGYWNQVHPRNPSGADSSFLPLNTDGTSRYADVEFREGRVFSIIMRFDTGNLDQSVARLIARAERPPDARLVFDEGSTSRATTSTTSASCCSIRARRWRFPAPTPPASSAS